MGTRIVQCVIFILLGLFPCSGLSSATDQSEENIVVIGRKREVKHGEEKQVDDELLVLSSISTTQNDITTPIPTVPTMNIPSSSGSATTTTNVPVVNPAVSNPDSPPATTNNPVMSTPTTTTSSSSSSSSTSSTGSSWCVASQSAPQIALQVALDYACGYGGADCSAIQPGGSCYNPNTLRDHASSAFNSYYQNNPVPNSCNFGGTAIITNTDPSYETCQYPSTSTSSSVLNTTNSSGSTVFGAGRPSTPTSAAAACTSLPNIFISTALIIMLLLAH
ncbi:glucan endo-1,3-beta-glucosidase 4 [Cornus florida]|uniref:glucan endo-1,3-beta-glucosidase 4 n=1 Tax=Cornus florida TaxID=4283 RepID=UPI0028A1B140|nr:glucan endo-1,3-beta-glucosidase 4 [Cornus florida]XP_059663339.1 glucan endo-1,3-beta-glucosidase 4 [Cornus florida]